MKQITETIWCDFHLGYTVPEKVPATEVVVLSYRDSGLRELDLCVECSASLDDLIGKLVVDAREHTTDSVTLYRCPQCTRSFSRTGLGAHLARTHRIRDLFSRTEMVTKVVEAAAR